MKKLYCIALAAITVLGLHATQKQSDEKFKTVRAIYKKKPPFYFRFPPQLASIKGPVIMAKARQRLKDLGICKFEMVKDVKSGKLFGWCSSKKIRGYPTIYAIDPKKPTVPISKYNIETTFNKYAQLLIEEINKKEKEVKSD